MSNRSTREARALVEGLLLAGVDEVVVAPGSRNGPLSIALAQAAASGAFRLHVRVDERSASFLALGLSRRNHHPAAVVCTSGTAAAHFHAAAYEATESGVPLLLITADRPAALRGMGANQTIDQHHMFGAAVVHSIDCDVATEESATQWHDVVRDAVGQSRGSDVRPAGAVHLNLQFVEPLVPGDADTSWTATLPSPTTPQPSEVLRGEWSTLWPDAGTTPRGAVITSDPLQAADVVAFADALRWPVLAEPGSGARLNGAILDYRSLVSDPTLTPDVVVTVGRFALSRGVAAFVRSAPRHVSVGRSPSDPLGTRSVQLPRLPDVTGVTPSDSSWLEAWQRADAAPRARSRRESLIAAALATMQPGDLVYYGPSTTIRDAERVAPAFDDVITSLMNRGANGIDGVTSSAIGAALAHQRRKHDSFAMALMGDLTFLHDLNGLLIEAQSAVPDLALVVMDSNGGRIFADLEQGAPEYRAVFDRVYGTPHNRDLAALAGALGAPAQRVEAEHDLTRALDTARERGGISVIIVDDRE